MTIYIKNMVSESCKYVVRQALEDLDIIVTKIELGEIETSERISKEEIIKINLKIKEVGLEILEKENSIWVNKIKALVIEYVFNSNEKPRVKLSDFISEKLKKNYSYLSKSFSEAEDSTIEQYLVALKIERVKELIIFEEESFSQIAFKLHYSSVAHLSKQFKKVTGLTPSQYKLLKEKKRVSIQEL